ncbi:hypothetical protein RugamoR64_26330 [Duganella rhizosphaerae]
MHSKHNHFLTIAAPSKSFQSPLDKLCELIKQALNSIWMNWDTLTFSSFYRVYQENSLSNYSTK